MWFRGLLLPQLFWLTSNALQVEKSLQIQLLARFVKNGTLWREIHRSTAIKEHPDKLKSALWRLLPGQSTWMYARIAIKHLSPPEDNTRNLSKAVELYQKKGCTPLHKDSWEITCRKQVLTQAVATTVWRTWPQGDLPCYMGAWNGNLREPVIRHWWTLGSSC